MAQEHERAHLARELHDNLSQHVTLLAIDLELLNASNRSAADRARLAREALDRAHSVARSLHDLASRLHPVKLHLIGLTAAIDALRRELSHPDLEITFAHDGVPADLPHDLTLCLFRIVQEALGNAITYSGGRRISVVLAASDGALTLTVADDGVGFDVDAAWNRGLGLVSMVQRAEAAGGTLRIESRKGDGARLCVRVPCRNAPATEIAGV
jgi:signal transduction histidine kinase